MRTTTIDKYTLNNLVRDQKIDHKRIKEMERFLGKIEIIHQKNLAEISIVIDLLRNLDKDITFKQIVLLSFQKNPYGCSNLQDFTAKISEETKIVSENIINNFPEIYYYKPRLSVDGLSSSILNLIKSVCKTVARITNPISKNNQNLPKPKIP